MAVLVTLLLAVSFVAPAPAAAEEETITSHGLSVFDDSLRYDADFPHFDYVNPDAPKGGIHHTWDLGSFDSLTPLTEKGPDRGSLGVFDSLMVGTLDALDQMYGLIADRATYPPDRSWVSFTMRPES